MKKKMVIVISGARGVGKTTLANALKSIALLAGIQMEIIETNRAFSELEKRLMAEE